MFALPGLLAIVLVDYLRPQEYYEFLKGIPLLHMGAALAAVGFVVDLRLGISRLRAAPHFLPATLLVVWCLVTVLVRTPDQLVRQGMTLAIPYAIYLLLAHGIQSFRSLEAIGGVLLAIAVALAALGVHQGTAPWGCHWLQYRDGDPLAFYDGRPCETRLDCENESAEPGTDYRCERVGLLGTSTIKGRVRYRGSMEDPNDLSLALGIAIPIAFAFYDRRRTFPRLALVVLTSVLAGLCAILTQSRGGQLVFLAVLGVYFVRRVGVGKGLATGLVLAMPMLLLGGRSGGESSTYERTICWWVGLHLFVAAPVFGVGFGQFLEYHRQTAHNSHVLAAAELGLPGVLLWVVILYLSVKIPLLGLRAQAPVARTWSLALLASYCGLIVGVTFLSHTYKDVTWIFVALSGALYHAIRQNDPGFEVRLRGRDLAGVVVLTLALLTSHIGFTAYKLGW